MSIENLEQFQAVKKEHTEEVQESLIIEKIKKLFRDYPDWMRTMTEQDGGLRRFDNFKDLTGYTEFLEKLKQLRGTLDKRDFKKMMLQAKEEMEAEYKAKQQKTPDPDIK